MGCCFSSGFDVVSASSSSSSALVISPTGDLRPCSTPVFVSDVLQMYSSDSFFVCNSDSLSYDEYIKAMEPHDELDAGQIYFVLPCSKLHDRLSASEMAALAVKASVALNSKTTNTTGMGIGMCKGRKKKSKIMPFVAMESSKMNVVVDEEIGQLVQKQQGPGLGVSRSGSIRKTHRRNARLAVRSFRFRLATIYESDQSHKYSNNIS